MNEFQISYQINNSYENEIRKAFFQLLVIPEHTKNCRIIELQTDCSLKNSEFVTSNYFGFKVLQYASKTPIKGFDFELKVKVQIDTLNPFDFIPTEVNEELAIINTIDFQLEHALFLRSTPLTEIKVNDERFQLSLNDGVFNFLKELNAAIHATMQYQPNITNTKTTAFEALSLGKGVCQDYTHIFLSIARQYGIPARYVSGYLHQGGSFIGSGQTHAWVEAFLPKVGWIGFDPTNNLLVDHHYIKIAHGCDYRDCSPITGILETSGAQKNIHTVHIFNQ